MLSRLAPMLSSETPLDSSSQFLTIALEHADAHVQSATQKGVKPAALAEITSILDEMRQMLQGPTTEGRASAAAMPAMSPGVAPVTDISQTSSSLSDAPPATMAGGLQSTIDAVASPPRPTPPTGA
jgi:hypothetical protein